MEVIGYIDMYFFN